MKTVSYSLDEDIVEGIAEIAQYSRTSKSDVVRAMYLSFELERSLQAAQAKAAPRLAELGIETEDDLADYLYSLKKSKKSTP